MLIVMHIANKNAPEIYSVLRYNTDIYVKWVKTIRMKKLFAAVEAALPECLCATADVNKDMDVTFHP